MTPPDLPIWSDLRITIPHVLWLGFRPSYPQNKTVLFCFDELYLFPPYDDAHICLYASVFYQNDRPFVLIRLDPDGTEKELCRCL
jgi:hypothetical protein